MESFIPHPQNHPKAQRWHGVPAKCVPKINSSPSLIDNSPSQSPQKETDNPKLKKYSPWKHTIYTLAWRWFGGFVVSGPIWFILVGAFMVLDLQNLELNQISTSKALGVLSLIVILSSLSSLINLALFCRLLPRIKEGKYSVWSSHLIWIKLKERCIYYANLILSGTLFWPYWLRMSGMKVGPDSEISTIMEVIPELTTLEGRCFFADGIYLGGPSFSITPNQELIYSVAPLSIRHSTFIGNHSVIPSGLVLPPNLLFGVCTVAHQSQTQSNTAWFGHPAFQLPRREKIKMDESFTHKPSLIRYINRLFWETLRFILGIPLIIITCICLLYTSPSPRD